MPRIEDQVRDSITYLYPSVEAAEKGETDDGQRVGGGSGFLVWVKSERNEYLGFVYAVTNAHVIKEAKSPVVRVNNRDGSTIIKAFTVADWKTHKNSDLAMVCFESMISDSTPLYRAIKSDMLITKEMVELLNIGLGDDVYMVGRFVHHAGKKQNMPSARSGIVSMMPNTDEPIRMTKKDSEPEAFLIEMRSLSGFSGSPVIFSIPPEHGELRIERGGKIERGDIELGAWLLGIDRGNFCFREKVREQVPDGRLKNSDTLFVDTHSGHSVVIPAWRLTEMINREDFAMARKQAEEEQDYVRVDDFGRLDAETSKGKAIDEEQGISKEGFEDALRRASRHVSQPDEETK
ncbi:MAG: serine protease [Pyrinomonadaceae bacterium]